MNELRFRLRKENKVVGFLKLIHKIQFFSKDEFAWSGKKIEFSEKDAFTGCFDKNKRALYDQDIILLSAYPQKHFILHFDEALNTFQLIDFETKTIFESDALTFFKSTAVTWVSYAFIN
jgi:hypothetical protein